MVWINLHFLFLKHSRDQIRYQISDSKIRQSASQELQLHILKNSMHVCNYIYLYIHCIDIIAIVFTSAFITRPTIHQVIIIRRSQWLPAFSTRPFCSQVAYLICTVKIWTRKTERLKTTKVYTDLKILVVFYISFYNILDHDLLQIKEILDGKLTNQTRDMTSDCMTKQKTFI
jgi:hypothetical protein